MDKKMLIVLTMVLGMNVVLATTGEGLGGLKNVFWAIACDVYRLLLPVAFLAMIAAAVIYAFGQVGHAEMRAKAQSWAMWALVAGIVALIILLIMPTILKVLFESAAGSEAVGDTEFPECCTASCSLSASTISCNCYS